MQAQGLFGAARARLEAALATAGGSERARLLGALGLIAGDFAQLAELRLPDAELDPAPWRRGGWKAGRPVFTPPSLPPTAGSQRPSPLSPIPFPPFPTPMGRRPPRASVSAPWSG